MTVEDYIDDKEDTIGFLTIKELVGYMLVGDQNECEISIVIDDKRVNINVEILRCTDK